MFEIDTSRAAELAYKESEYVRDSQTMQYLKELSSSYIAMSGDSSKTESIEFSSGEASFASDSFLDESCSFVSSRKRTEYYRRAIVNRPRKSSFLAKMVRECVFLGIINVQGLLPFLVCLCNWVRAS